MSVHISEPSSRSQTSPWAIVTWREMRVKLTDRGFWVGMGVTFAMLIIGFGASMLFGSSSSDLKVAVTSDQAATLANSAATTRQQLGEHVTVTVVRAADPTDAEAKVDDNDADLALLSEEGRWVVVGKETSGSIFVSAVTQVLKTQEMQDLAKQAGVSASELSQRTTVETRTLGDESPKRGIAMLLGIVFGVIFIISASTYGMQIAQSVLEEKQSRIVEILVALVPVRQLLAGKVLGNTIIAVAQTALLVVAALVGTSFTDFAAMLPSLRGAVTWFVVFFVAGFLALACMWAAAGAMCTRNEDLQQTGLPMMMIVTLAYMSGFLATGVWKIVLSYVPIASTILMPVRIFEGSAQWWEAGVSLLITLAFAVGMVLTGGRIYRRSLLQTRGRLTFRQAFTLTGEALGE